MFDTLNLKPTYSSYEDDIAEEFYVPVLEKAIKYDRATAYFSAKALALYARGLEAFAREGHKYRLIISTQLTESDYNQIIEGYRYREIIDENLLPKLRETLSLEEERNISNLAYLISLGVIDIKMAFTKRGIFHDKFGIVEDAAGNVISYRGSNNETEAAINANYESFDITCSWQSSPFDYQRIVNAKATFERLWQNPNNDVVVKDIDQVLYDEIMIHNKNMIISETALIEEDAVVLDLDNSVLTLRINKGLNPKDIWIGRLHRLRLNPYLDNGRETERKKFFKSTLTYTDYKKIISILEQDSNARGYKFLVTNRLSKFIEEKEFHISERKVMGIQIKNRSEQVLEKYEEYKRIVDNEMERKLREQQMWDSFFMCSMKRSSNFSVPGSGKTSSVYGVYAYLRSKGLVNKIVMIGPKNSFGSWIDEFHACFGSKQQLNLFNIQSSELLNVEDKKRAILFNTGGKNLLLFNYEGVGAYRKELRSIIDSKTLLVMDEVHKVKLYDSDGMGNRAENVFFVSENAGFSIALTGTPIPNSYLDINNLLHILYRNEYDDFFGFDYRQLKKPSGRDIDEINDKLKPFYCRTNKRQLGVPECNRDEFVRALATEEENSLFNILLQKYRNNKLALIIRLMQLESDPKMLLNKLDLSDFSDVLDVSGDIEDIDFVDFSDDVKDLVAQIKQTQKFKDCISLIENLHTQKKPVIVWCVFVDSIKNIKRELENKGIKTGVIYGEIASEERASVLQEFRNKEIDVLITNPHTLAESVSLHSVCHDAVYFEYSYNLVHLLQSKDRIHRLGLPDAQYTQYYYLSEVYRSDAGDYSLGEQIFNRLSYKEQVMLDAIENQVLEEVTSPQEDIDLIFGTLGL